jgi:hypothetical protein
MPREKAAGQKQSKHLFPKLSHEVPFSVNSLSNVEA